MSGLGETTARLAGLRKAMEHPPGPGDDAGLTEVRGFGFNPGGLRMLAYVPAGLAPNAPLVVVLHGCTQRAGAHARSAGWITLADRLGFAVLAPEQRNENNPNRCFNWFEPVDIARDSGEAASIHAMSQHMVRAHKLDPARVFITGLSAGGAMTSVLLATYPETFAAGAVVAGLPFGVARNAQEAFGAMHGGTRLDGKALGGRVDRAAPPPRRRPRLAIWHGEADAVVVSGNAQALARQWAAYLRLDEQPDEVQARARWTRSVWRGSDGEPIIEMNLLAGLGHGTPLAASGVDPIGQAAPFMLEAGVSSSLEIARFWGLAPPEAAAQAEAWSDLGPAPSSHEPRSRRLGDKIMATISPHVPEGVQQVIAKALTSAGLMG
ncbi:PHB depolymerase family esterase [Phenylobacterium sp. LjRoot225]|uniref:extracellular catalytic domain type 1 short-chain-length polyhydroxyalkanoate depolymerase n=1 Tax=Phenylobacterium sp. LjRoot225 TaxID=3342285 RepID=UPI003ECC7398